MSSVLQSGDSNYFESSDWSRMKKLPRQTQSVTGIVHLLMWLGELRGRFLVLNHHKSHSGCLVCWSLSTLTRRAFRSSLNNGVHCPKISIECRVGGSIRVIETMESKRKQEGSKPKNHDTRNELNTQWSWKKARERSFFEQCPDCKQVWDLEQSNRFLFNLTVISRSGTFFLQ